MSIMSRTEGGEHPPSRTDAEVGIDRGNRAGGYLTDGANLYRSLGTIPGGMGEMVGVENCRSLEVVLLPIGELHARGLRVVIPADDPPAHG